MIGQSHTPHRAPAQSDSSLPPVLPRTGRCEAGRRRTPSGGRVTGGFVAACPPLRSPSSAGDAVTFCYGIGDVSATSTEGGWRGATLRRGHAQPFELDGGEPISEEETSQFRFGTNPDYELKRTEPPPWLKV